MKKKLLFSYDVFLKQPEEFFISLRNLFKKTTAPILHETVEPIVYEERKISKISNSVGNFFLLVKKMRHTMYLKEIVQYLFERKKEEYFTVSTDSGEIIYQDWKKIVKSKSERMKMILRKIRRATDEAYGNR